jgi:hypothetical protein
MHNFLAVYNDVNGLQDSMAELEDIVGGNVLINDLSMSMDESTKGI